ncbi:hypothetical protein QF049_001068 [Paenibacillus sp. W4I10]|uniref:hypothetical protein n=1 Tax=Paenibacillus sp. W4I10 TaxID=3042298 RepID=UPI00277D6107|nr:hypothetical protein [Paenibacillus sp. W4I10]MDQ0719807.1 hypothetical protein [Paenibacillus sp. W4I10]
MDDTKKEQVQPAQETLKKKAAEAVTLEDYLSRVKVHMGLVASFRYEARSNPELLKDKTDEQWTATLEQQSQAQYE